MLTALLDDDALQGLMKDEKYDCFLSHILKMHKAGRNYIQDDPWNFSIQRGMDANVTSILCTHAANVPKYVYYFRSNYLLSNRFRYTSW
jgi:hypothetical protein